MKEAYPCIVDVQPGETCTNHGQPSWATWKNVEPYLPPVFYNIHGGVSSLRGLFSWLRMDPITTQDGHTVAQKTVPMFGHFLNICL